MLSVKLIPTHAGFANVIVIGSVKDVIAGIVKKELRQQKFDATKYLFGFELASPRSVESFGESVLVNNYCYATSTDPNYYYQKTIYGKTFYTTGMLLVPKQTSANYLIQKANYSKGISYDDFCQAIYREVQRPCVYVALLRFKQLNTAYIKKPPIYGENIFAHQEAYYGGSQETFSDCTCFVIGVLANFATDPSLITDKLADVLYHNPFDKQAVLQSHTHGLVLNQKAADLAALEPSKVTHTVHIYNKNTIISEIIWGEIFVVNEIFKEA